MYKYADLKLILMLNCIETLFRVPRNSETEYNPRQSFPFIGYIRNEHKPTKAKTMKQTIRGINIAIMF